MKKRRSSRPLPVSAHPWRYGALLAAWLPIVLLTLWPSEESSRVPNSLFCVVCGEAGIANLVRNVLLFVPFGVALRLIGVNAWKSAGLIGATTLSIELLQLGIPGRNPGLVDVSANFVGGVLGSVAAGASSRLLEEILEGARWPVALWSLLASVLLLATSVTFRVHIPDAPLFGHHRPRLGHLSEYRGQVLGATIDGVAMPHGRLPDSERVRRALVDGATVAVTAAGPIRAPDLTPIVMITNGRYEEVLLIGIEGKDLVARVRYLADELRLHRPDVRFPDAFTHVGANDSVSVTLTTRGGASCLSIGGHRRCAIGPHLEEGWTLLMSPAGLPTWLRRGLDFTWMCLLVVPVALLGGRNRVTFAGCALLLGAGLSGWWLGSVSPPTPLGMAAMVTGLIAGAGCRSLVLACRRDRRVEPEGP